MSDGGVGGVVAGRRGSGPPEIHVFGVLESYFVAFVLEVDGMGFISSLHIFDWLVIEEGLLCRITRVMRVDNIAVIMSCAPMSYTEMDTVDFVCEDRREKEA